MHASLIIGVDGSVAGRDAVALGRRLALATGARPTVIYVRSPRPTTAEIPAVPDDWSWGASVATTLDEARFMLADVPSAQFQGVAETSVARVLHGAAEQAGAALIVLGSTHRTGIGRVVPGTTAEAVIHASPCAVAIVPSGYAEHAARRPFGLVTAAVDGGPETERVASVASRIARRANATLRLVTVVVRPYTHGPAFAGNLGYASMADAVHDGAAGVLDRAIGATEAGCRTERHVVEGVVADELAKETEHADLLVIGSRGHGPVRRVILGPETGKVLRAATCPVLVIPRRTAEERDDAPVPLAAATLATAGSPHGGARVDG
jgi:nucleotide-binding universal stress UspA family protein